MARRTRSSQSKHDRMVRRVAAGYLGQGWKVQADISNYPKPRTIYGKRPDVIAIKGRKMRITEVETRDSVRKDVAQRNSFKRFASLNKKRSFRTRVV